MHAAAAAANKQTTISLLLFVFMLAHIRSIELDALVVSIEEI